MDRRRHRPLSLDLLRGFCVAARHLSFTRAARELFVTPSAISREIKTLEQQLGKSLFRRVNRALQLTEAGRDLYAAVDEGLAIIDGAALRVASARRTLSVTTTVALASTWLVPRLPRFAALHPDIDMRLLASNDAIDLAREHIDVALRYVPGSGVTRSQDKLFDYFQFPVCSPAFARDFRRPLRTPDDLTEHVLLDFESILYGRSWSDWHCWFDAMRLHGMMGARWLRFSHYDQVIEAAMKGTGIAVGKLPHLTDHLRSGRLVAPLGDEYVARPGAFHVEIAQSASGDVAQRFLSWVRAEARTVPTSVTPRRAGAAKRASRVVRRS